MSKKHKGVKLPKDIAGVKIPKELRRTAETLIDRANTPAGRQAIGSGLAIAATAAAAMAARSRTRAAPHADAAGDPAAAPGPAAPDPVTQIADAVSGAVGMLAARFSAPGS